MKIAKTIFGLIGTAILGLLATYITIPEWVLMNLERHFLQTVWGFLISAALGGAAVFIVFSTYVSWRLGSRPCKAFDDLKRIDGLGDCESLADMVERIKKLVKDHEKAIAELKSRISDLEDSSRKALEQVRTPSGKLCANLAAVRTLPMETIQAMLDAFDRGGSTDLGRHEECVRRSIANKDGIFRLGTMWFNGAPGDPDGTYLLTNEWKSFMDDTKVLAAMRDLARPSGPVWQTLLSPEE